MCGEHGLDQQALEQRRDLRWRDARGREPHDHVPQTAFLGIAGAAEIVAPAADAVNPLGEIDDFEVRGERADQRFGITRRQALDQSLELVGGARDRRVARPLDELEKRFATLLADDVADQRAECPDVVPQLRVLRRELDGAPFVNRKPPRA